jgi:superfamily II DNA/RNA helicase
VAVVLQRFGYDADQISSDLTQMARDRVMERIRHGSLRFLVATDVAARGIDLPELSHVILYDPPEDPEAYIHRAGRTGRAGSSGAAISLVNSLEKSSLQRIAKRYAIDLQEAQLPTDEDVERVVSERVIALLEARLRSRDKLKSERMQRFLPLAHQLKRMKVPASWRCSSMTFTRRRSMRPLRRQKRKMSFIAARMEKSTAGVPAGRGARKALKGERLVRVNRV